jgi:hypothetical protein
LEHDHQPVVKLNQENMDVTQISQAGKPPKYKTKIATQRWSDNCQAS